MRNKLDEQKHYQSLAQYYTNISILKRCKASIHLENKSDELFWKAIFSEYFPTESFNYIYYSKSVEGNDTTGCEQCLKYRPYLNKTFLICIDSDYRYILQEPDLNIEHFIFQTYTYSFENHICHSQGLNYICKLSCNFDNDIYDFNKFFNKYSSIIYDLFIWHIVLFQNNPLYFNKDEFCKIINLKDIDYDIQNQSKGLLDELRLRVNTKIELLEKAHSKFDLDAEKSKYSVLGIKEESVYLYIRGHNLFSLCSSIAKEVCHKILDSEKSKLNSHETGALYNAIKDFDKMIAKNIQFGLYSEIQKIEEDMIAYKAI